MRNKKEKLISIIFSVMIHLLLLGIASLFQVSQLEVTTKKQERIIEVKISKATRATQSQPPKKFSPSETIKFESPFMSASVEALMKEEKIKMKEKKVFFPEKEMLEMANRELPMEDYDIKEWPEDYDTIKKIRKRVIDSDLSEAVELSYEDTISDAQKHLSENTLVKDSIDKDPGIVPQMRSNIFDMTKRIDLAKVETQVFPVIFREKQVGDFTSDLVWLLQTYQDPKDQMKYFQITIRVGEGAKRLPAHPKEVIFLVDCSKSVEDQRLQGFVEGIKKVLGKLNDDDFFNIIAFKEWATEFKKESVKPTQFHINKAIEFIQKLHVGEKTDAYGVLYETLKRKTKTAATYLILLSDGRPTKGVTNPREFINKISQLNDGRVSIFAFSGGMRINRYLLDFISYKNKGWSEYAPRTNLMDVGLENLYDKIDEPIIMNLRYYISGIDEEETFPMILPDFFRNAEFTLYGKYNDEKNFVMQLLGDIQGQTKEFMVESTFKDAIIGDELIAKNWAFNKIYHLIGLLKHDQDNSALVTEINSLSKQFGLTTPYLKNILK